MHRKKSNNKLVSYMLIIIIVFLGIWGIIGSNGNGPIITIKPLDAFMLSYIDINERVKVRYSFDGYRWEDGRYPRTLCDRGVGSAATSDVVGSIRYLAYTNVTGKLIINAGLGPTEWDSLGRTYDETTIHGKPGLAYNATNHLVVTGLGGSLNCTAKMYSINTSSHELTENSPGLAGVRADIFHSPPEIIASGSKVVIAGLRYTAIGDIDSHPNSVRIVVGETRDDGSVEWINESLMGSSESGFGNVISHPGLSSDNGKFYLGVVRKRTSLDTYRLFIYSSENGTSWSIADYIDGVSFVEHSAVQIAVHGEDRMIAFINGPGLRIMYRKYRSDWAQVRTANVFGTGTISWQHCSLISAGKDRYPIYVDGSDMVEPYKGTEADPYKDLHVALDEAKRGDIIFIKGTNANGPYTVPQGVTLQAWGDANALIQGPDDQPVLNVKGDNTIKNLIISQGSVGINLLTNDAIAGLQGDGSSAYLTVEGNIIRNVLTGIQIYATSASALGVDNRRVLFAEIHRNWIYDMPAAGIGFYHLGPSSGSFNIASDIKDNVIENAFSGITLSSEGSAPNAGGYVKCNMTGYISNNLIIGGQNGISLRAENAGYVSPHIMFNTLDNQFNYAVLCTQQGGSHGDGRVDADLLNNIISNSQICGFKEFDERCSPSSFRHNLFFGNVNHYYDFETDRNINSASEINALSEQYFNNKLGNPIYTRGEFRWRPSLFDYGEVSEYFLKQDVAPFSAALNAGMPSVTLESFLGFTTNVTYEEDTGIPDIGFHYSEY